MKLLVLALLVLTLTTLTWANKADHNKADHEDYKDEEMGGMKHHDNWLYSWPKPEPSPSPEARPGHVKFSRFPTPNLINCLCWQDSGCENDVCYNLMGSEYCGFFRINEQYWNDCHGGKDDWKACASDYLCARQCVIDYLTKYVEWCSDVPPQPEDYARLHWSGYDECYSFTSGAYWYNINQCLNDEELLDMIPRH